MLRKRAAVTCHLIAVVIFADYTIRLTKQDNIMGRENHWAHMSTPINESMLSDIINLHQCLASVISGETVDSVYKLLEDIEDKYKETDNWKEAI